MPATPKSALRTIQQDKSRQARVDAKARKACVEAVWKRAQSLCEKCGFRVERFTGQPQWWMVGHVHEIKPRSLGGSPHDPDNCLLLCAYKCHREAHHQ